jgi:ABC-type molybdenum transport system ATPase subunit/photorepair protein PhrA
MAGPDALIELTDATLVRGGARVLHGATLRIHAGEHTAILGPNGAGKSSLIRMLTLEDRPLRQDEGVSLRLFGQDRFDVEEIRRRLGVVTGDLDATFGLGTSGGRLTGLHVTASGLFGSQGVFAHHQISDEMWSRARDALRRVDVEHLAARALNQMSTGERRRVVIARALVTAPDVLVLDEPTAGLDIVARHQFLDAMSRLADAGTTVVLVTHHVEEILPATQQVALLQSGRIVYTGPPAEALTAQRLSSLFEAPITVERSGRYFHVRMAGSSNDCEIPIPDPRSPIPDPVPAGSWPSPITAASVAAGSLRLSAVSVDGDDVYWLEGRPTEGGRQVLVRRSAEGAVGDVTPAPFNVRTRVHEYGGGAYLADSGAVWFSNFSDGRVYRVAVVDGGTGDGEAVDGAVPRAVTGAAACQYADFAPDSIRDRIVCVREDHTVEGREARTEIIAIAADGSTTVLASGRDFYSNPRVDRDGTMMTWLCWDHPQMPWDGTELWVADVDADGALANERRLAGGVNESIYGPGWTPDGTVLFASDRTGWWQLYRWTPGGDVSPLIVNPPAESEFGKPQWVFGTATWACAEPSQVVVTFARRGVWYLGVVSTASGTLRMLDTGFEPQDWLVATSSHALLVAASPTRPAVVMRVRLVDAHVEVLKVSSESVPEAGYLSVGEAIEFPTAGGRTAHAFYYSCQGVGGAFIF